MAPKVILAGGSGFIGQALARHLAAAGWAPVILTRTPRDGTLFREIRWNGETGGAWVAELAGATALINLAGRSINCVHTVAHREEIVASREHAMRALGQGWATAKNPPLLWVQASATGFYGDSGNRPCAESLPAGPDFLAEVCRRWEDSFTALELPGVRRVVLRLGVVLGRDGGVFPSLAKLTHWYLGGSAGRGRQYLSWIHLDDALAMFRTALTHAHWNGTYNACAPQPVTNAEFMHTLRAALGRPWCPPAPEFVVRLAARHLLHTAPDLVLQGQRCLPGRAQAAGFIFHHGTLAAALTDLAQPTPTAPRPIPANVN